MSRPLRVLLIEDSEYDAALLLPVLREGGYAPVCERVETAAAMVAALDRQTWDVVIADYVLPRFSGPAALKILQERGLDLPFIIISGHVDEDTAVASMKAGAHDYVMKDRLVRLVPAIEREMQEAEVRRARKTSDEKLVVEHGFRRAIEDSIPSGIAVVDRDGGHAYVNAAFCQMVGWSEKELLGAKPPYPYWPPEEIESIQRSVAGASKGEFPATGAELRFCHRSGRRFDVLLLATPMKDSRGAPNGWLGSVTDITARKLAEEALRRAHDELEKRVRERTADLTLANLKLENSIRERRRLENELLEITEKERRRIGLDLHDDLGQKLAGLALMMKGLERSLNIKAQPEAAEAGRISELISQTMKHASDLAHDLTLVDFEGDDLSAALKSLAANVKKLFQIDCRFKSGRRIPPLEQGVIAQIYKITQEAVTNAVKHGKAANVAINLVQEPSHLVLSIRSDGLPFPSMIDQKKGMGLRLMNYRASVIGASLEVKAASPPGGTVVTCLLPTPPGNGPGGR